MTQFLTLNGLDRRGSNLPMVLVLCICVTMQMLGVPGTLLNPALSSDILGSSVLEGFSVPSTLLQLTPLKETFAVTEKPLSLHLPILASVLFHPPLL
jgi:hypothetical protein